MLCCRLHNCTCLLQFLQQLSSAVIIEAHPADNNIECSDKYKCRYQSLSVPDKKILPMIYKFGIFGKL